VKKIVIIISLALSFGLYVSAQQKLGKIIQFSGYALTSDSLMGIPFVHVTIMNRGRVATAGPDGFFSFPAVEGDTLYFTSVGYRPEVYIVPTGLNNDKYSVVQLMSRSENYLHPAVIFPWKDFHQAFMDYRPPEDNLERAKRNLDRERLAELGKKLEPDGREVAQRDLQERAVNNTYYGQTAPQNIFNPLAWADFIQAWKSGAFKQGAGGNNQGNGGTINSEDLYTTPPGGK
jgi:hypothetical protein